MFDGTPGETSYETIRRQRNELAVAKAELAEKREEIDRLSYCLERQYSHQLGEMARLSDIVCGWVLEASNGKSSQHNVVEVVAAANGLMEYVEAVRP